MIRASDSGTRLIWHALANCTGLIVSGLVGFVLVPVMLHHLGSGEYGLWIAMESAAAILARADLGLNWAVTREIGAECKTGYRPATRTFVSASGSVALLLGVSGALIMAAAGSLVGGALGVSRTVAMLVFAIGGVAFLSESVKVYSLAVLRGIRRFDVMNAILAGAALVWGAGGIAILAVGAGLIPLVVWQVIASAFAAGAALVAARIYGGDLKLRFAWPRFDALREQVRFSLSSQLVTVAGSAIWEIPAFIIGFVSGAGEMVPYYIGRMLPSAASGVAWRSAEVLFPAASVHDENPRPQVARGILDLGTRLNMLAMLPICIILWICAPALLKIWVGPASGEAILILRVLLVAELFDAAALGSSTILWAGGAAGTLLTVDLATLALVIGLCVFLVSWLGATGAAIGLTVSVAAGSVVYLGLASRDHYNNLLGLVGSACRGLGLPSVACIVATSLVAWALPAKPVLATLAEALAGGSAYLVVLQALGARPEEAEVLSSLGQLPARFMKLLSARLSADR